MVLITYYLVLITHTYILSEEKLININWFCCKDFDLFLLEINIHKWCEFCSVAQRASLHAKQTSADADIKKVKYWALNQPGQYIGLPLIWNSCLFSFWHTLLFSFFVFRCIEVSMCWFTCGITHVTHIYSW